ncbi:MAG: tetratricopeptide repeat protein [bacterium]|nr:tetratricopeptide repeat protein [bacterium]
MRNLYSPVAALLVGLSLVVGGCVTPGSPAPNTASPTAKDRLVEQNAGRREIEEARRMIEAGQYASVVPRLLMTISKYPNTTSALDARYWLAVTYHKIASYHDAIHVFNEYLEMAPNGQYSEQASKYVSTLTAEYERKYWTPEKLQTRIAQLRADMAKDPNNSKAQWELADMLWKRGDYGEAARIYAGFVEKDPAYAQDKLVATRVELHSSGKYTILSPSEVLRRAIEKEPLVVTNVNAWKGGLSQVSYSTRGSAAIDRSAQYYVVTGQVTNRADSTLYGVQVIITIYGFGNIVYDTRTVNIGRLNPGDTRAFSVRFSNFNGIENIHRYECIGTFQR